MSFFRITLSYCLWISVSLLPQVSWCPPKSHGPCHISKAVGHFPQLCLEISKEVNLGCVTCSRSHVMFQKENWVAMGSPCSPHSPLPRPRQLSITPLGNVSRYVCSRTYFLPETAEVPLPGSKERQHICRVLEGPHWRAFSVWIITSSLTMKTKGTKMNLSPTQMPVFKINLSGGILTESKLNHVRGSSAESLALSQKAII